MVMCERALVNKWPLSQLSPRDLAAVKGADVCTYAQTAHKAYGL